MRDAAPEKRRLPQATSLSSDLVRGDIDDARSHDLVFAVVGHVGAGASWVAEMLAEELRGIDYHVNLIKMSDLIEKAAVHTDVAKLDRPNRYHRTCYLQDVGDKLRERFGESFIGGLAIRDMSTKRATLENGKHQAFILDSLKHPKEVEALRDVYGRSFYLVSVVCHRQERWRRLGLKYKGRKETEIERLMQRDEAGSNKYSQRVRDTLQLGDVFVRNDYPESTSEKNLIDDLQRFRNIITGRGVVRPTRDERGMYAAWGASLRSSCMSRQVGAALLASDGEILATGTNDVPKYGGGLYQDGDSPDQRCYRWDGRPSKPQCHNDKAKEDIYKEIYERLFEESLLAADVDLTRVKECIEGTRVKGLIEFSRAVHAEMDALLSLTRKGSVSSVGTTLYCTTYPCHGCARQIVAAGVEEVVYIEPYVKSLAANLHRDTIYESTSTEPQSKKQVCFRLFSGIAPRRFATLFEQRESLKDRQGNFVPPEGRAHQDRVFKKTFLEFERNIADRVLKQLESSEVMHVG